MWLWWVVNTWYHHVNNSTSFYYLLHFITAAFVLFPLISIFLGCLHAQIECIFKNFTNFFFNYELNNNFLKFKWLILIWEIRFFPFKERKRNRQFWRHSCKLVVESESIPLKLKWNEMNFKINIELVVCPRITRVLNYFILLLY